jgi:hypothetical protein
VFFDVFGRITNSGDLLSRIVGDFHAEFFFEGHDQFDSVERVRTQIVDEAGAFNNLFSVNAEMINNNFLHAFCDIAHVGFLDLLNLRGVWTTSLPCFKPASIFSATGKPVQPRFNEQNHAIKRIAIPVKFGTTVHSQGPLNTV